jgi:hypothetical protein
METNSLARLRLWGVALFLLGAALVGQERVGGQEAPTSRDNFHSKSGKLKRLTPAELDKAVETDFDEERDDQAEGEERASSSRAEATVPSHRLSRDVLSAKSFAKSAVAKKGNKEFQITLKNPTIEKYKNRATLVTPYQVVASRVHQVREDGDMHVAGLADEVVLPCVAEIMNIRDFTSAKKLVQQLEKSHETTMLTGVFRLWCEHPDSHGNGPQIQDDVIPAYEDSNPAHVFEIHPITRIGQIDVLDSLVPIPDEYKAKDAKKAFKVYESLTCRIVPDPEQQTTTLFTRKVGYNYVKFKLRVDEDQHLLTFDTRIVRCSVLTLDDEEIVNDRRMVFVQNSPPERKVQGLRKGDTLTVMGMPRIDLAIVSWRTRNASAGPEALTWNLPYEMIIVGVYGDEVTQALPSWPRLTNILYHSQLFTPTSGSRRNRPEELARKVGTLNQIIGSYQRDLGPAETAQPGKTVIRFLSPTRAAGVGVNE